MNVSPVACAKADEQSKWECGGSASALVGELLQPPCPSVLLHFWASFVRNSILLGSCIHKR